MFITLMLLSALLILLSVLPFVKNQHWFFRVGEFIKLQLLVLQVAFVIVIFFYIGQYPELWYVQAPQLILIFYHVYILARYTKFWRNSTPRPDKDSISEPVKIISCNIYQFNTDYDRFIDLIQIEDPDIFLTMESNAAWEQAMQVLEGDYPYSEKVTLENTYGIHFYTRLKVIRSETHFFVADDVPSVEVELETSDGQRFVFFGVHPPPPSPTEEETSKERDGDLLSVAKLVRDYETPVVVVGDFNNVAWAKSSILFKKTSRLIDARVGRGILSTFHAKYWFFRVPLDLLFHSPEVFIDKLFIYPSIGSDHFPIGSTFHIDLKNDEQKSEVEDLEDNEHSEVEELIQEGKEEESDERE